MERRIKLIIGKSGFGKTWLTRILLKSELRSIVLEQRLESRPYEGLRFSEFDALADYCSDHHFFRCVWTGGLDYADAIFQLGLALKDVALTVEEADLVECEGWFKEVVYRGRDPAHVTLYALAQRPQLFSIDLRSQATDVYAFNTSEDTALRWLEIFFNEQVWQLPQLEVAHGLSWTIVPSVKIERFKLADSTKTISNKPLTNPLEGDKLEPSQPPLTRPSSDMPCEGIS